MTPLGRLGRKTSTQTNKINMVCVELYIIGFSANNAEDNLITQAAFIRSSTGIEFGIPHIVSRADNLHEISNFFLGKIRIYQNVICWNFYSAC